LKSQSQHTTPQPELTHILITPKRGTYPVHPHWFDTTPVCEHRAERERLQRIADLMKRRTVRVNERAL